MKSSLKRGLFAFQLCFLLVLLLCFHNAEGKCQKGCDLALASYYVWQGSNLTFIDNIFGPGVIQDIVSFNRDTVPDQNSIVAGMRIHIPFSCECLNGEFLAHTFNYVTQFGDTYEKIAKQAFSNLTTEDWIRRVNTYDPNYIPDFVPINVTVNCSCGDKDVSEDYGLFATYPLLPEDNLSSISATTGLPAELLQRFNLALNFSTGEGIVFLPAKDGTGTYPPLSLSSNGLSHGAIAGISVAAVFGLISALVCSYLVFYRRNKMIKTSLALVSSEEQTNGLGMKKTSEDGPFVRGDSSKLSGITVDKSVEFSYEELAKATDNFSMDNKIGQGGFGSVYFGEVRGERAAIKKMDMQASKEFLAELKVLTHVHHLNLVRLIGYCVEGSLFVVYEYIENGNLSQHLRGSKKDTLSWNSRMQIALDSARGLEYIHEHTVPLYIHRDIKSANILIDKCFHAKVADFGLTKLTEVGTSLQTRLVGTFGYMPPEYAQYGEISPKIDVYAFGVVLYELISGKEAILKMNEQVTETKGLVSVFEEAFNQPSFSEALKKLVDPRLGDDYSLDSISKMANLARASTHDNPQLRPSMRSIVVALMTLSSSSEDWDIGSFYEKQGLIHHLSGR